MPEPSTQSVIYLDHNATTPVDPQVLEAMWPFFREVFGNAASAHALGCRAHSAAEHARSQVAALIAADPREIIWTSGATESNNLAIKGAAEHYREKGRHIITAVHEHRAVVDPCRRLAEQGYDITWLRPEAGSGGAISAAQVADAIRDDTILVSLMWANNETGVISDVPAIGAACRDRGVIFHTDATQYVGKLPVNVNDACVDLLSASSHKHYGPKGVGWLFVRRKRPRVRLMAQLDGGSHERTMRSGTLNVPGIVGAGAAAALCAKRMQSEASRLWALRDMFERELSSRVENVTINGVTQSADSAGVSRMPHVSNVGFEELDALALLRSMPAIAASTGAACSSATLEPSYVLRAIGASIALAHGSVRFSFGRSNDEAQVRVAVSTLEKAVADMRAQAANRPPDDVSCAT